MKKKLITALLAITLVVGNTGVSFGATNHRNIINEMLKNWITYNVTQENSKTTEILTLVNNERKAKGLSVLTIDANVNKVAQKKAEDMARNGYFSHNSPTYGSPFDMLNYFGVSYKTAGENIAKGQKTATSVMNGWMNSSGHRANILNSKYKKLGVGYATDSKGNTYWVQMFIG